MYELNARSRTKLLAYGVACAAALALWALFASPAHRLEVGRDLARSQGDELKVSAPPRPEPQRVKPLLREQAIAINAARPLMRGGLQAALPFKDGDKFADPGAYRAAVDCLTAAIYYEAGGESEAGQRAVAQVVLNRVRHPTFPPTVCQVVYQGSERPTGCQFTFACDGSLARQPSRRGWDEARRIAERALAGRIEPLVGMATHYHANWVVPYWAPDLDKIASVGSHIFYRWRGFWGHRQAFSRQYAGEGASSSRPGPGEALLAKWDGAPTQPTGSAPQDRAQQDGFKARVPLLADETTSELVADQLPGRLVTPDQPMSVPDANLSRASMAGMQVTPQ